VLAAVLVIMSCHRAPSTPSTPSTAKVLGTEDGASMDRPREAFVVLGPDQTLVIPFDPDRPPITLPGWWVGALVDDGPAAYGRVDVEVSLAGPPDAPAVAVCTSAEHSDPCALDGHSWTTLGLKVSVDRDGKSQWEPFDPRDGSACSCVTVSGVSTDGEPEPWADADDPEIVLDAEVAGFSVERYIDECNPEDLRPEFVATSYFGGVVYRNGMFHTQGCSGVNILEGVHEEIVMRPGVVPLTRPDTGRLTCAEGLDYGLDYDALLGEDACVLGTETCENYDACEPEVGELRAFALHRGSLVHVVGNVSTVGGTCMCAGLESLERSWCASPLDPCGSSRRFPQLEAWDEHWVSTNERAALAMSEERFAVFRWGRETPVRTAPREPWLLGVEYHADSALLDVDPPPPVLRVRWPSLDATDASFGGSAREWGDRCVLHLRAGRLDAAEAACFAGLAEGGSDRTRGALTYNLGRIEEEREAPERALDYYRRSDRLRPDHPEVRARIGELTGH
jgi:hypothetical protein